MFEYCQQISWENKGGMKPEVQMDGMGIGSLGREILLPPH